jgi:hypothetical protein
VASTNSGETETASAYYSTVLDVSVCAHAYDHAWMDRVFTGIIQAAFLSQRATTIATATTSASVRPSVPAAIQEASDRHYRDLSLLDTTGLRMAITDAGLSNRDTDFCIATAAMRDEHFAEHGDTVFTASDRDFLKRLGMHGNTVDRCLEAVQGKDIDGWQLEVIDPGASYSADNPSVRVIKGERYIGGKARMLRWTRTTARTTAPDRTEHLTVLTTVQPLCIAARSSITESGTCEPVATQPLMRLSQVDVRREAVGAASLPVETVQGSTMTPPTVQQRHIAPNQVYTSRQGHAEHVTYSDLTRSDLDLAPHDDVAALLSAIGRGCDIPGSTLSPSSFNQLHIREIDMQSRNDRHGYVGGVLFNPPFAVKLWFDGHDINGVTLKGTRPQWQAECVDDDVHEHGDGILYAGHYVMTSALLVEDHPPDGTPDDQYKDDYYAPGFWYTATVAGAHNIHEAMQAMQRSEGFVWNTRDQSLAATGQQGNVGIYRFVKGINAEADQIMREAGL